MNKKIYILDDDEMAKKIFSQLIRNPSEANRTSSGMKMSGPDSGAAVNSSNSNNNNYGYNNNNGYNGNNGNNNNANNYGQQGNNAPHNNMAALDPSILRSLLEKFLKEAK